MGKRHQYLLDQRNFELCESQQRNLDRIISNNISQNQSVPSLNKYTWLESDLFFLPDSSSKSYLTPKIDELFIKFQELNKQVSKFCSIIDQCKNLSHRAALSALQGNNYKKQQVIVLKDFIVEKSQRLSQNFNNKNKQDLFQYKKLEIQGKNSITHRKQKAKQISKKGQFYSKYQQVLNKYSFKQKKGGPKKIRK